MTDIFSGYRLGGLQLANRIVMAPMTRNRATPRACPTASMATYYAQRAGAGLIVTEGTQPSAVGQGYPRTPGLHTDEQVEGWRARRRRRARAGRRHLRPDHARRPDLPPEGHRHRRRSRPSAITPAGEVFTAGRARTRSRRRARWRPRSSPGIVEEFVDAARSAVAAGLDGVELHAANGYLLQQFLATAPTSAPTATAVRRRTAPASWSRWPGRRRRDRRRPGRHAGLPEHVDFNDNAETEAARRTPPCWTASSRWAWPTCTS